ncbi:MAG: sterol desaturase family protein [Kofleriaceae bacterium]|nr:sterol desaturase family protein [Kofleriaceae bacterium]
MIAVVAAVAIGVMSWTLLEYVIHRWGGHHRRFRRTPFGKEHLRHHVEGDYFAPTGAKVLASALVGGVILAVAVPLVGAGPGLAYVAGLLGCYGLYEWHHRRDHTHPGTGWYGRWARRHHFHHHFVDGRANFGVTSPLWDHVFGTYRTVERIAVPRRLAMSWLLDPATGEIRAEYTETFALRG